MSSKPSKSSSSENTIQADVGPGDKTGIYYITICNLPFGSSWQELKDWLRQACTVDHIELFQTSTSGWIRLRGKQNFEKAWRHINTVDFKGRSIIASDKNKTESIKIKELVESPSHYKKERKSPTSKIPYFQTPRPTRYGPQHASTQYSAASYGQFYMHGYPQSNGGVSYSASPVAMSAYNATPTIPHQTLVDPYAGTSPGLGYGEQHSPSVGSAGRSPYEGVQYVMPYCTQPAAASYTNAYSNTAEPVNPNVYIQTEPRKILIRQLPRQATAEEITAWIQGTTRQYAQEISCIEVPPNDKNRARGHAYVIFKTTEAAQAAIGLLDQALFHPYQVSARFTREGVKVNEQESTLASTSPHTRKDTKGARNGGSKGHRMRYKECGPSPYYGHSKPEKKKTIKTFGKREIKASETRETSPLEWKGIEWKEIEWKEIETPPKENKPMERKATRAEGQPVEKENKVWPVIADGSSRQRAE